MRARLQPHVRLARRIWLSIALSLFVGTAFATAGAGQNASTTSAVSLGDIIQTRMIDSLFLSPDGHRLAFRVISPSIATNALSEQWFAVETNGHGRPMPLGQRHPVIFEPLFDLVADGFGMWSRDSRSLYILEQRGSAIIIARLEPNRTDRAITHDHADVVDFAPSPDRSALIYHVRNSRRDIAAAQSQEEAEGVHFDGSVYADGMRLTKSFRIGERMLSVRDQGGIYPAQAFSGPLRTKTLVLALPAAEEPAEIQMQTINPFQQVAFNRGAVATIHYSDGFSLHLDAQSDGVDGATSTLYRLSAASPSGDTTACLAAQCTGSPIELRQVLPGLDHEAIVLSEADRVPQTKLLGWTATTGRIRTIYDAGSSLNGGSMATGAGCVTSYDAIFCVEASATRPARLIRIDLRSGQSATLADPNIRLRGAAYPVVRALTWRDGNGRSATGVLVLPSASARKLPLVLTTYSCRGYLHGGITSLTPEFILAERGIASLCVNLDPNLPAPRDAKGRDLPLGLNRAEIDVYAAAIHTLALEGLVDAQRVGISGHSFSAMVIAYAISHDHLFKAASLGTGVLTDPMSFYVRAPLPGSEGRTAISVNGLPPVDEDPDHVWNQVSGALNARKIDAAILIQPPENEWLDALQLLSAVRDAKGTAEMYVYPNAGHLLARYPRQQYMRAQRSIDWFCRWLLNEPVTRP